MPVKFPQLAALWVILINFAAFLLMGADKARARRGAWRISEKALFLPALFGGAAGATAGMYLFRHKTRHWYFRFGLPLLLLLQLAGALWLLSRFYL